MNINKTDTHTILTLQLSRDFNVPSFIQNESSSVIESILLQSQELFELQKSLSFKQSDTSLKAFYDKKVLEATLEAQKTYSSDLQRWQNERSKLCQQIASLQIDLQEKVALASTSLESKNQELSGKLLAATSQIHQLQDDRLDLEKRTRDFVSKTLTDSFSSQLINIKDAHSRDNKTLIDSFSNQLTSIKEAHLRDSQNLKGFIESYKVQLDSYKNKYDDLISQKTKTSTKLGQLGERSFEDLCVDAGIHVTNTGKESHKGDLIGIIGDNKILIEVKNYSYTVTTKEVNKFKRDMDENKDCVMGVFVSMNTPIANIPNQFHIDWLSDKRPVIFISEMNTHDGKYLLDIVKNFIGVIQHYSVDDCDDKLQEKIERAVKGLEISVNKLSNIIKNIRLYRKQSNEMFTTIETDAKHIKDEISHSLAVLSGKLMDDEAVIDTPIEIAPAKKRSKKSSSSP